MGARGVASWAGACVLLVALAKPSAAEGLRLEEVGGEPMPVPGVGNADLSGLTWVGGTRYLAVDDARSQLVPLDVTADPASGSLVSILAGPPVALQGARDVEGVAWLAARKSVLVCDELLGELREHDPESGELRRRVPAPPPFAGAFRTDTGFEGVAIAPDGRAAWTANEGPLGGDGLRATEQEGAWIRLLRLDAALAPTAQFAYRTEPGRGFVGVVDLLVAPGGALLVLERALTGGGFATRIFAVELGGASDVSRVPRLAGGASFRPAAKRKLWERTGGFQNFEGATLGPALANGDRLVLLVSDGGGKRPATLLALRLVAP